MTSAPKFHEYEDRASLAEALTAGIAAVLAGAIATRGYASLAVSGGSTPKLMFERLSQTEIDWADVHVTLVDERWVPEDSDRSNAANVRRHLLQNHAEAATFTPLYDGGPDPESSLDAVADRVEQLAGPFDVVVLGMGEDGHTASFFPGAPNLPRAIDAMTKAPVAAIRAPAAGEPRITLTLPPLLDARFLALHIEGESKRAVFEKAMGDGPVEDLPVRSVLRAERERAVEVFWAP